MKKVIYALMLSSGLAACSRKDSKSSVEANADKDSNIYSVKRYMPELERDVTIFYNFNDSTQTITREYYEGYHAGTFSFSRRGLDELKGTEAKERDSIIKVRSLTTF